MRNKRLTLAQRIAKRTAAMPEVKKLVRRYGRATITNCLGKLAQEAKVQKEIKALQAKVRELKNKK